MYSRVKQQYYAAIVQEAAAQRAREEIPSFEEVPTVEEFAYEDIGRKSLAAFSNLLDILSGAKTQSHVSAPAVPDNKLGEQVAAVAASLDTVRRDLTAFASRTDRVLLDLLKRMEAQEAKAPAFADAESSSAHTVGLQVGAAGSLVGYGRRPGRPGHVGHGNGEDGVEGGAPVRAERRRRDGEYERVPKDVTRQKILAAARDLAAEGMKLTLAACARKAGVAYYKAVYACKESDELADLMNGSAG
ncbi:MAG: hypothetical protein VB144_04090 [Clostridia bacterium]|nr:hypothetical protein [Clostridia bacterium]